MADGVGKAHACVHEWEQVSSTREQGAYINRQGLDTWRMTFGVGVYAHDRGEPNRTVTSRHVKRSGLMSGLEERTGGIKKEGVRERHAADDECLSVWGVPLV